MELIDIPKLGRIQYLICKDGLNDGMQRLLWGMFEIAISFISSYSQSVSHFGKIGESFSEEYAGIQVLANACASRIGLDEEKEIKGTGERASEDTKARTEKAGAEVATSENMEVRTAEEMETGGVVAEDAEVSASEEVRTEASERQRDEIGHIIVPYGGCNKMGVSQKEIYAMVDHCEEKCDFCGCIRVFNINPALIKEEHGIFDFGTFSKQICDDVFWKEIERNVVRETTSFMRALPYRRRDKEVRLDLIRRTFDIIYIQHENSQFLKDAIGNEELANALCEVIQMSEDMIVLMCASKRRVKKYMIDALCVEDEDLEYIWGLYEENSAAVQTLCSAKSSIRLERKVNYLKQRMDGMERLIKLLLKELEND